MHRIGFHIGSRNRLAVQTFDFVQTKKPQWRVCGKRDGSGINPLASGQRALKLVL